METGTCKLDIFSDKISHYHPSQLHFFFWGGGLRKEERKCVKGKSERVRKRERGTEQQKVNKKEKQMPGVQSRQMGMRRVNYVFALEDEQLYYF